MNIYEALNLIISPTHKVDICIKSYWVFSNCWQNQYSQSASAGRGRSSFPWAHLDTTVITLSKGWLSTNQSWLHHPVKSTKHLFAGSSSSKWDPYTRQFYGRFERALNVFSRSTQPLVCKLSYLVKYLQEVSKLCSHKTYSYKPQDCMCEKTGCLLRSLPAWQEFTMLGHTLQLSLCPEK